MKRTKKLHKIKKLPFWRDYVLAENRTSFLQAEEEYTHDKLIDFYAAPSGEEKEKCRKIVLDKRLVFLKKYIAGEVELKQYNETKETVFKMFYKWIKY